MAGHQLKTPPAELLGTAALPARRDRLQAWVESQREGAQGLILSLDTWIYGNLVASRKNRESLHLLQERIQLLQGLKEQGLALHGFATLLRLSNSNDDTEERPYWARFGQQIYRFSWLEHFLAQHQKTAEHDNPEQNQVTPELLNEYAALQAAIPAEVLSDYQSLRSRNHNVLTDLLQAVSKDVLQTLLIGCDDGGSHGWTVLERQQILSEIEANKLEKSVLIYPGADELASTLVARVLEPGIPRLRIAWSYPEACEGITRYEGQALNQTLAQQAQAAGVQLIQSEQEPVDGLIWIHNPPGEQIDQFLDRETRIQHDQERFKPLLAVLNEQLPVALADVCYANGGDLQLLELLEKETLLFRLQGYAGWNTAGNTLGMLLAWMKLSLMQTPDPTAQQGFLIERLADDGWYQGYLRQQLCSHYSEPVTINSCIQAIAFYNDKFRNWLKWMPDAPEVLQIQHLSFPWRRFFEVDLKVCFKESQYSQ